MLPMKKRKQHAKTQTLIALVVCFEPDDAIILAVE
jgi:hypothetical protein